MKVLLVGVLALVAAGYLVVAGWQVHQFLRVSQPTMGVVESVSVEKTGSDRFQLRVAYRYPEGAGKLLLPRPLFRNEWAAEQHAGDLESIPVWYDLNQPERSRLDHRFPHKAITYAAIILGVFLYFLWLVRFREENAAV